MARRPEPFKTGHLAKGNSCAEVKPEDKKRVSAKAERSRKSTVMAREVAKVELRWSQK